MREDSCYRQWWSVSYSIYSGVPPVAIGVTDGEKKQKKLVEMCTKTHFQVIVLD